MKSQNVYASQGFIRLQRLSNNECQHHLPQRYRSRADVISLSNVFNLELELEKKMVKCTFHYILRFSEEQKNSQMHNDIYFI